MIHRVPGQSPAFAGAVTAAGLVFTSGLVSPAVLAGRPRALAEQAADVFEVLCEPADLTAVRAALVDAGVEVEEASVAQRPKSLVPLDEDGATKLLKLIDGLEDQDDVDAEILERVAG